MADPRLGLSICISSGFGMIRYNLRCEKGHAFESWFQSSAAYESQEKRRLVSCPACGSVKVERAIMARRS